MEQHVPKSRKPSKHLTAQNTPKKNGTAATGYSIPETIRDRLESHYMEIHQPPYCALVRRE